METSLQKTDHQARKKKKEEEEEKITIQWHALC